MYNTPTTTKRKNQQKNQPKKNLKTEKKSYYNYWRRVNWAGSTPTTVLKRDHHGRRREIQPILADRHWFPIPNAFDGFRRVCVHVLKYV